MSVRHSVRSELRRLYESNIAGAALFGQTWAVSDYRSRIEHLDEHPRGPLTARMRRDRDYFGSNVRVKPRSTSVRG
jgi:hypothetical protein